MNPDKGASSLPSYSTKSPLDGYLTKHQLAAALGCSPRTLDRWHTRRIGPPRTKVKGTRLIAYHRDHVAAWIASNAEEQA